ncbi:uncharacterized protein BP01DRAFT_350061 [Aspergillus saccharolyticus JOP 1030-1]|uniref:Uncharacterized protein n=1 Tax=Aspergillus saccharolyticus JOP 1030-1 TaxID=1450539 RepID=A0A318ZBZ2_9EURO|nr:hypothetical protein BP01DRAFT_350061 [Aspergillus saccharolyticus JOP 1030-1]PYH41000.1 hypothetical protein BP01DRAFT_350061 [Aspergillus saccharolyticus JOP 1030-1]
MKHEIPLPEICLRSAAESVLKIFQVSCLSNEAFSTETFRRKLNPDIQLLVKNCQEFGETGIHNKDIAHMFDNQSLCDHVQSISQHLSRDVLLKLSFLTWYFDAHGSVSTELRYFLANPVDNFNLVFENIWQSLVNRSEYHKTKLEFFQEMITLLKELNTAFVHRCNVIYFPMLKGRDTVCFLQSL